MKKVRKKSSPRSSNSSSQPLAPAFFQKPFTDSRFFADNWVPEIWREEKLKEQF